MEAIDFWIDSVKNTSKEREKTIYGSYNVYKLPINPDRFNDWDMCAWEEDSYQGGEVIHDIIKEECSDISKIEYVDGYKLIVFEYKRENKGGNQPTRCIYVGEFLGHDEKEILIRGFKCSYASYISEQLRWKGVFKKLKNLELFEKKIVDYIYSQLKN